MADAVAARREARRRRILENSHNRLQLIAGKKEDESPRDSPITTIITEENHEHPIASASTSHSNFCFLNGAVVSEPESYASSSATLTSHDIDAAGDGEITEDFPLLATLTNLTVPTIPPQEPVPEKSLMVKLTANKYDVVLLSLFIQLTHSLSLITFEDSYFFLPLIIYVVTKLIWFPTQSNSNIANVLLLLNGMSAGRVQKILQITQYAGVIASDVSVFLFTTICVQSLSQLMKDSFIT